MARKPVTSFIKLYINNVTYNKRQAYFSSPPSPGRNAITAPPPPLAIINYTMYIAQKDNEADPCYFSSTTAPFAGRPTDRSRRLPLPAPSFFPNKFYDPAIRLPGFLVPSFKTKRRAEPVSVENTRRRTWKLEN